MENHRFPGGTGLAALVFGSVSLKGLALVFGFKFFVACEDDVFMLFCLF